ncbi:hypothetical protein C2845_PM18G12190 [Panicum miliaceum]|uniref:Uncharacterized protein n=1 Tax=Panicum miliaceum TaxID=4540 RepID=A0A3L6PKC1_PANMI|nr:hypothetical protein C2845_PM18G12190 [Panicum miliaceum]
MAGAQGAVDSLLGRLTSALLDEAPLLGGLRGDVEFIKDEMETMNALLRHLTDDDAQRRDHLVRAWMKQVSGLSRDCEGNLELYLHRVGGPVADPSGGSYLLRHLRRLLWLLRTLSARHRIATRIRELKVRARDVGDRRKRYGITVPDSAGADAYEVDAQYSTEGAAGNEKDLRRRAVLLGGAEPPSDEQEIVTKGIGTLIKCLSKEPAPATAGTRDHEIGGVRAGQEDDEQLASNLRGHLKDKRFLIVITRVSKEYFSWKSLLDALLHAADGCHPGSAIILTTWHDEVALSSSPYKIINARSLTEFYATYKLTGDRWYDMLTGDTRYLIVRNLLSDSSAFARKMFLHLLYVNPTMTEEELSRFRNAILKCQRLNKSVAQRIVMFCYDELPSKYRSCLLYLSIFPEGHLIKTTSLARRWIAEGIVTATTRSDELAKSAVDEAEHYWDELLTRGFISPVEISAAGNIKSFTLHHEVHKVITKIVRDGLEKHHLKSICKILLLKYLSLRNTDVTELPKQIKELQCLETLDIRQTKVRMLARKAIVLPLLKHFLAGHKISGSNDARLSEESFPSVEMPLGIQKMKNMEILSHVQVSNSDSEPASIAQLLKLRKLGVALHSRKVKLSDLFRQIEKLHKCLRSLSIRMDRPAGSGNHDEEELVEALPSIPQFIERLNICGITSRLVCSIIKEQHQLSKITLSETHLKEDDLCILGNLGGLRGLRLQHKSYTGSEFAFKKCEFQSLIYLLVEGQDITNIRFATGAAPKLEWIVWSFATMDALSGIDWLPKLKKVELNGDCDLDPIQEALEGHPNAAILEHKPRQHRQEE